MLRTDALDFELPDELIATRPAERRDGSRLLVISRSDPELLEHRRFSDLPGQLASGDAMVFNRSAVVAARFEGRNASTGGRVSGLYLRDGDEPGTMLAMLKARRVRVGGVLELLGPGGSACVEIVGRGEDGAWVLRVEGGLGVRGVGGLGVYGLLGRVGLPPLPPYILNARSREAGETEWDEDLARYQTVYAKEAGSVAAPTAGLHFTPELLGELGRRGVDRREVVLHVGRGTFQPVESETVEDHPMHAEWCSMDGACEGGIARARKRGGRVFCVGTTSARTLESFALARERGEAGESLETDLLITPGYRWRWVDGLVTNFHLPRSTLLAMVASLLDGGAEAGSEWGVGGVVGVERLLAVYREAIRERYRFFSYGDAMLVLP